MRHVRPWASKQMGIQHAATLNKYYDLTWEHRGRERERVEHDMDKVSVLSARLCSTAMKVPPESRSAVKPQTKEVVHVAQIKHLVADTSCSRHVISPLQTLCY